MSPKEIADGVLAGAEVIRQRKLVIDTRTGAAREVELSQADKF